MIPLRDCIRPKKYPYVNTSLIIITLGIYFWELTFSQADFIQLINTYAVVPHRFIQNFFFSTTTTSIWIPFITSIFLHGGWLHVLGNMLYLWVFGDNVEDRLGHWRYLILYLGAGVIGSLLQIFINPTSEIPIIGASGAIAGVLGAYMISFPRARIETLVILIIFITIIRIPAVVFIFFWFALQLLNGLASLPGGIEQIAWWAHIGGFMGGIVLLQLLKTDEPVS